MSTIRHDVNNSSNLTKEQYEIWLKEINKTDVYKKLHQLLANPDVHMYIKCTDKYLKNAIGNFLTDLGFSKNETSDPNEEVNSYIYIDLERYFYSFKDSNDTDGSENYIAPRLFPSDWNLVVNIVENYLIDNPIPIKEVVVKNTEEWSTPIGWDDEPETENIIFKNVDSNNEIIEDISIKHVFTVSTKNSDDIPSRILYTYTEPTDIIIYGYNDNHTDIEIDDDYTYFNIQLGKKSINSIESEGFISINPIDVFLKDMSTTLNSSEIANENDARFFDNVFLLKDYVGDISLSIEDDNGVFYTKVFTDYIAHSVECPTVTLHINENAEIYDYDYEMYLKNVKGIYYIPEHGKIADANVETVEEKYINKVFLLNTNSETFYVLAVDEHHATSILVKKQLIKDMTQISETSDVSYYFYDDIKFSDTSIQKLYNGEFGIVSYEGREILIDN